jgi:hypothetical protein
MSNDSPPLLSARLAQGLLQQMGPTDLWLSGHSEIMAALEAIASGKTECRPAGAVPADVEGLLREADKWIGDYHDDPTPVADGGLLDRAEHLMCQLYCALRGRVVGGAAPGEREAFEAWFRTQWPMYTLLRSADEKGYFYDMPNAAWLAWQASATGPLEYVVPLVATPAMLDALDHAMPGQYKIGRKEARKIWDAVVEAAPFHARAALTSAAPPPPAVWGGFTEMDKVTLKHLQFAMTSDQRALVPGIETLAGEALHLIRRMSEALAAPPPRCVHGKTASECGQTACEAPPPVVPQVVQDAARYRWLRDAANTGHSAWLRLTHIDCVGELFDAEVDAALGAAQRPDMAVGRAHRQHESAARASLSDTVPSTTKEKP